MANNSDKQVKKTQSMIWGGYTKPTGVTTQMKVIDE